MTSGWVGIALHPLRSVVTTASLIVILLPYLVGLAISKGIDRDRAVDESGNQLAVFGRRGARPLNREETERLYLRKGQVYTVSDEAAGGPKSASTGGIPEGWIGHFRAWLEGWY